MLELSIYMQQRLDELMLSKTELAKRMKCSRQQIYNMINNDCKDIKLETFIQLSSALNEHPVALLKKLHVSNKYYNKVADSTSLYQGDYIGFIASIDDREIVAAGSKVFQTWIVQNIGRHTWRDRQLRCIDEKLEVNSNDDKLDCFSNQPWLIPDSPAIDIPETPPLEKVELTVQFTAPDIAGTASSYWKIFDNKGQPCFPESDPMYCRVLVKSY